MSEEVEQELSVGDDQKLRVAGLWEILKRYDNYVGAVNFRCGLIASFSAAVFGGVFLKAEKIVSGSGALNLLLTLSLIAVALLSLLTIYFVVKTIFPDLRTNLEKKNAPSLIFFQTVAKDYSCEKYVDTVSAVSIDDFERDLATQVHEVAVITKDKFANVAKAATSLKFMLGALACAVILEVVQSSGIRLCLS